MPTLEELNKEYEGIHILVNDERHPDHGKKCAFVQMVRKPFDKQPLMQVKMMTEGRILELKAKQIFFIVAEMTLPSGKDN